MLKKIIEKNKSMHSMLILIEQSTNMLSSLNSSLPVSHTRRHDMSVGVGSITDLVNQFLGTSTKIDCGQLQ